MSSKLPQIKCDACSLEPLCLPVGLEHDEVDLFNAIISDKPVIEAEAYLIKAEQALSELYTVRSGSLKAFRISESGEEHIMGFYFPGDLIGLDAIAEQRHHYNIQALETASLCAIPFDDLCQLTSKQPRLQAQLIKLMSQQINQQASLRFNCDAEQRLMQFLLDISKCYQRRGYSAKAFNLSMSRDDIANYLGLAKETVSRLFKKLQQKNLVCINRRAVELNLESMI